MTTDENPNRQNRLIELGGSDFKVADGQPDIRGWSVKDATGQKLGEVEDLLFDPQALKVRYIILDLEGNVLDLEPRHVLAPIGIAELHDADDEVLLPGVSAAHLSSLPTYEKDRFDTSTEASVRSAFAGAGGAAVAGAAATGIGEDFYNHDMYNEHNLSRRRQTPPPAGAASTDSIPVVEEELHVGKREVETGGAIIRSRVVEQEVEEDVRLREEHVTVERNPVDRPATAADVANIKEGEMEITEHAEVPVVNKEARVVEEINIRKDVEEHDEVIRDTVRGTDVDIKEITPDDPRYTDRKNPDRPLSE